MKPLIQQSLPKGERQEPHLPELREHGETKCSKHPEPCLTIRVDSKALLEDMPPIQRVQSDTEEGQNEMHIQRKAKVLWFSRDLKVPGFAGKI